jgi:hypothetical protein
LALSRFIVQQDEISYPKWTPFLRFADPLHNLKKDIQSEIDVWNEKISFRLKTIKQAMLTTFRATQSATASSTSLNSLCPLDSSHEKSTKTSIQPN